MRTRRVRERFCVAVVICAAACACAVQRGEPVFVPAQEASVFTRDLCKAAAFSNTSEARLADIGREVLDPVRYSHPFSNSANTQARTLPAVPAAIVMTLLGFFCVSITRDRRAWLALAGALVWLGQAGVEAVPQLAHRIWVRTIRQSTAGLRLSLSPAMGEQPTGCNEQIIYAGLLQKLAAIPEHILALTSGNDTKAHSSAGTTDSRRTFQAVDTWIWSDAVQKCPAGAGGHIRVFSPAFTFANLSRGPPAWTPDGNIRNVGESV